MAPAFSLVSRPPYVMPPRTYGYPATLNPAEPATPSVPDEPVAPKRPRRCARGLCFARRLSLCEATWSRTRHWAIWVNIVSVG